MTITQKATVSSGKNYLHTTPELREKRQAAVAEFVKKDYPSGDTVESSEAWKRHNAAIAALGLTTTALVGAGVIAATAHHGGAAVAPNFTGAIGPAAPSAPTTQVIAAGDTVGQIADEAVQGRYHTQDGKKVDTFAEATPAFRFRAGLGRPTDAQLRTAQRVDNVARNGNHDREGIEVSGRGSGAHLFGRYYQAPEIPSLANFEPVVK